MRISNVGMYVRDLEKAKAFFEDYFGAEVATVYNEEENHYYSYIMKLGDGPKLEIMHKPEIVDEKKNRNRTGFIHICIKLDSKEQLDEVIAKMKRDGYEILYEPATSGGKEVRAITFEDNILEVCY